MSKSKITINGQDYVGGSIIVRNGKVFIDGKDKTPDQKEISIEVHGDIDEIGADALDHIVINGQVKGSIKTMSGDVKCGDVGGSVSTMSGDVDAHHITGSVSTMSGDIHHTVGDTL